MKFSHMLFALSVAFLWGSNFIFSKIGLSHYPAIFFVAMRMALTGIILFPFVPRLKISWQKLAMIAFWFNVVGHGAMGTAIHMGLAASLASIIDQLRVPLCVVLSIWLLKERIYTRTIIGLIIALLGGIFIYGIPEETGNTFAMWLALFGGLGWAIYSIEVRKLKHVNPLSLLCYTSLIGSGYLFVISAITETGQMEALTFAPMEANIALMLLVGFGTIYAHGLWSWLLLRYDVSLISPFSLLVAPVSVLISYFYLDEQLTYPMVIGGMLTLVGVSIIVMRKPQMAAEGEEM